MCTNLELGGASALKAPCWSPWTDNDCTAGLLSTMPLFQRLPSRASSSLDFNGPVPQKQLNYWLGAADKSRQTGIVRVANRFPREIYTGRGGFYGDKRGEILRLGCQSRDPEADGSSTPGYARQTLLYLLGKPSLCDETWTSMTSRSHQNSLQLLNLKAIESTAADI